MSATGLVFLEQTSAKGKHKHNIRRLCYELDMTIPKHFSHASLTRWLFSLPLLLFLYCFTHTLILGLDWHLMASVKWALTHSTGIIIIFFASLHWQLKNGGLKIALVAISALVGSSLVASLTGQPFSFHQYNSVAAYILCSILFVMVVKPVRCKKVLRVDYGSVRQLVDVDNINLIQGAGNYLEIHVEDKPNVGLIRNTFAQIEEKLPDNFVRIHRSTMVNMCFVDKVCPASRGSLVLTLQGGKEMKVTSRHVPGFLRQWRFVTGQAVS